MATLRPLTRPQQEAARLAGERIDYAVIESRTGLSRSEIAAAVDLAALWEGAHTDVAVRPAPNPAPISAPPRRPAAHKTAPPSRPAPSADLVQPDPAEHAATAAPASERGGHPAAGEAARSAGPAAAAEPDRLDVAVSEMLRRAADSDDPRVRELADTIARQLAHLKELLDREEQTKPLRAQIARLEAELAARRQELAALNVRSPFKQSAALRRLYYSTAVRSWALSQRMPVAPRGSMSREVVEAFLAAHPEYSDAETDPAS